MALVMGMESDTDIILICIMLSQIHSLELEYINDLSALRLVIHPRHNFGDGFNE